MRSLRLIYCMVRGNLFRRTTGGPWLVAWVLATLLLCSAPVLLACRGPLQSSLTPVGEDYVLFVSGVLSSRMSTHWDRDRREYIRDEAKWAALQAAHRDFRKSGLYWKEGSKMPMWTSPWLNSYAHHRPHPAGRYMAWINNSEGGIDRPRLMILDNGEPIATYFLGDLVAEPERVPRSSVSREWAFDLSIDADAYTLMVETNERERLLFDLRTGARLEAPSYQERLGLTMQYGMSAFLGTAGLAIVGVGLIGRGTNAESVAW